MFLVFNTHLRVLKICFIQISVVLKKEIKRRKISLITKNPQKGATPPAGAAALVIPETDSLKPLVEFFIYLEKQ